MLNSRVEGGPPAADSDRLRELGSRLLSEPPTGVSHVPFGGYKQDSAFLVVFSGRSSSRARMVFKSVDLSQAAYPAISDFPGQVGLPEVDIYSSMSGDLAQYTPGLLDLEVVEPDVRYNYYLEDLSGPFRSGFGDRDDVRAADRVLAVAGALASWRSRNETARLIRYDGVFPERFIEFSRGALERYHSETGDPGVGEALEDWGRIEGLYLGATPDRADSVIHGDFRRGNVFHSRKQPATLKLVDWEFAGVGWIHNDLASALKLSSSRVVEGALRRIARDDPRRSYEQHRQLYYRCRLERGLLDASLVARQRLATVSNPRISPGHMRRVAESVAELQGMAR